MMLELMFLLITLEFDYTVIVDSSLKFGCYLG